MSWSGALPEDILRSIFSRVDPKDLGRAKSVCKSWSTLLSDPVFTASYHSLRLSLSTNHFSIVRAENHHISFFNNSTGHPLSSLCPLPARLVGNLVGTCRGLVCLRSFGGKEMLLWNPLTRMCKRIQNPSGNSRFLGGKIGFSFGLGLDVDGINFVCLRVVSGRLGDELIADVQLYSTLSDSWRTLEGDFQFNVLDYTNCIIVEGVPYWTAIVKDEDKEEEEDDGKDVFRKVLLAFDVRTEAFKQLEYPAFTCQGGLRDCFVVFEGSLSVIMRRAINAFNQCVDIWLFDEEASCWVKKHTVGPINVNIAGLVGFSVDKNVLGVDGDGNLFLFDSSTKNIKQLYSDVGNYWYIDIRGYTESLISVPGMIPIGTEETRQLPGAEVKMATDLLRMEVKDCVIEGNIRNLQ